MQHDLPADHAGARRLPCRRSLAPPAFRASGSQRSCASDWASTGWCSPTISRWPARTRPATSSRAPTRRSTRDATSSSSAMISTRWTICLRAGRRRHNRRSRGAGRGWPGADSAVADDGAGNARASQRPRQARRVDILVHARPVLLSYELERFVPSIAGATVGALLQYRLGSEAEVLPCDRTYRSRATA